MKLADLHIKRLWSEELYMNFSIINKHSQHPEQ